MRILLDENLPRSLGPLLTAHEVSSVATLGWRGTKNGELLRKAVACGFEVLITLDDDMSGEQNLPSLEIAILVLKPAKQGRSYVTALVPKILAALLKVRPGTVTRVQSQ